MFVGVGNPSGTGGIDRPSRHQSDLQVVCKEQQLVVIDELPLFVGIAQWENVLKDLQLVGEV